MNKSQTSGHNRLSPIGPCPLFHPEVCDLFAYTILKPRPLLLHYKRLWSYHLWYTKFLECGLLEYITKYQKAPSVSVTITDTARHRKYER